MSEENHPNLHAVGFLCDIFESLGKRVRGKAGKASQAEILGLFRDKVKDFVNEVDEMLDWKFGR